MNPRSKTLLAAALVAASALPVACGKKAPAPVAAPTTQPGGTTRPSVPALTAVQKTAIDAAFAEAATIVAQARKHREAAERIERESSVQDAYAEYREAKHLYVDAMQIVEEWLQEDYGKLTRAQIDAFMRPYQNDVAEWQKEMGRIPKVPPADD